MPSRASTPTSARTIFVVEDDPDMSATLSKALSASGYRVLSAASGADAHALFGEAQPDLIILDLILPDADGLFLTASFRALTSAPIIICSARHEQVDRVMTKKLGAADFMAKPFELDELEKRVEAALRWSAQPDEALPRHESQVLRQGHPTRPRVRRPHRLS